MRYDGDPRILCQELGRCAGWAWCTDCGSCYCNCSCVLDPLWWRDEWGQGTSVLSPIITLRVKGEYL